MLPNTPHHSLVIIFHLKAISSITKPRRISTRLTVFLNYIPSYSQLFSLFYSLNLVPLKVPPKNLHHTLFAYQLALLHSTLFPHLQYTHFEIPIRKLAVHALIRTIKTRCIFCPTLLFELLTHILLLAFHFSF